MFARFRIGKSLAKIVPQTTQNQRDDFVSGAQLVLEWAYRSVYGAFWGMKYGSGLRPEVARLLGETSPQLNQDDWIMQQFLQYRELEEFSAQNLVDEDWKLRRNAEIARGLCSWPEPKLFDNLMRANASRTVRKLVNQSKWLSRPSGLGFFLREEPERFLAIKESVRFPRSTDQRIEFLARSIAAILAGYEPSTGLRYLARHGICEQCCERPATMKLTRGSETWSWCGVC